MTWKISAGILGILLVGGLSFTLFRVDQARDIAQNNAEVSPVATVYSSPAAQATPLARKVVPSPMVIPTVSPELAQSIRLNVPFTVQAPDGEWVEPWKEGCEEAALLMADAFNRGDIRVKLPVLEMKEKIQQMVNWEIERFGSHKDLGVDAMAIIAKEYLGYTKVRIVKDGTIEDIQDTLRGGKPVILPAAGQRLKNPYFTSPGPVYHVFLVKGFEGTDFIVNENGTRQGEGYLYSQDILNIAWHDYAEGNLIETGARNFLVLEK